MKNIFFLLAILSSISVFSQSKLIGLWNTGKENTKIEILELNNKIIGKIKSSDNRDARIGKILLKDLIKDGGKWKGKIYSLKKDEWYDTEITPNNEVLEIEVIVGFFSKNLQWKKN